MSGKELIRKWLEKYKISYAVEEIVHIKPNALAYVDDKGIRFENWSNTLKELNKLKII